MRLHHMGANKKICLRYFELCQTYFKIQGTYFLPLENCLKTRTENADKHRRGKPQMRFKTTL